MSDDNLNDAVLAWGLANGWTSYDSAKRALIDGDTNLEVEAGFDSFNAGLLARALDAGFGVGDALLMESGDFLLLETGADKILIDF